MTGRMTLIALSAALALGIAGAASSAQAGGNSGEYTGGFKIGPQGQMFGSTGGPAFGFAYATRSHRYYEQREQRWMWRYEH